MTTRSRRQEYNLAGNGKSSILGTSGIVKLVRQKDGPVVGVHMIGARMGEQIGEAQLIVNWEAYPEDVAAAGPRPPDPERGPGRGAPGAGGQAAPRLGSSARTTARTPGLVHPAQKPGALSSNKAAIIRTKDQ